FGRARRLAAPAHHRLGTAAGGPGRLPEVPNQVRGMKAPLSWIRDFTPVEASTEELVAGLNQVGLEVEGGEEPGRDVRGVVAAGVPAVVKPPNADKLTLVDVDYGNGSTRVVCGAHNVAAGDVVPFAPAGAHLPEPFGVLERRKIRGVESDGMLLAQDEL